LLLTPATLTMSRHWGRVYWIEIHGRRIRLWGIDAPEAAQRCMEGGALYPCGLDASRALQKRLGASP
jgi:endonuclease YncB( thermonuclease family)